MEGRRLVALLKESLDALDEATETFSRLRTVVAGTPLTGTDATECDTVLRRAERRTKETRDEFTTILATIDRGPPAFQALVDCMNPRKN